jgi:hypothetical protein
MAGRSTRTPDQRKAFEATLQATGSIERSALAAGYSKAVASKGKADLPGELLSVVDVWQRAQELAKLGAQLKVEDVSNTIKGRLLKAVAAEEDATAINAAKTLGTMKDYNLFQSDNAIGVVVVQPSPAYEAEILRSMQEELDAESRVIPALPESPTE